jgi:hypothetical protein
MILARAKNLVKFGISDLNFKFLVGKVFHIPLLLGSFKPPKWFYKSASVIKWHDICHGKVGF